MKLFTIATLVTDGIRVQNLKQATKVSLGALNMGGWEGNSIVMEEATSQSYNNDCRIVLSSR
jgi:hypothetical protein